LTNLTPESINSISCSSCLSINKLPNNFNQKNITLKCYKCGSKLSINNKYNTSTSWALLISAIILYIPSNLLPVMNVVSFGKGQASTIFEGVIHFAEIGSYGLALIIFFASIFIPMIKFIFLIILLISVDFKYCSNLRAKTSIYRFLESIGKWSMVDVFVVALLVVLVQFGNLALIEVGSGTLSFSAVVILTMLATANFDSKWLWKSCES